MDASAPDPQAPAQSLVLVAEDNRTSRLLMTEQLRLLGYAAEVVANGKEALACWRGGRVAVVFTDLAMPEMDGYALTEAIRREERDGFRTPIVALTANARDEGSNRWKTSGMDDYLTKPASLAMLKEVLERWWSNVQGQRS